MNVREDLLVGDFSFCLRLLQSYPPTNVDSILEASRSLWIYESQVTLAVHRGGITLNQALHAIQPPPGIIMAFGLKGGVAPTLSNHIQDAAAVVQEQVEHTTSGLFYRAKRFLKEKAATVQPIDANQPEANVGRSPQAVLEETDNNTIQEIEPVTSPVTAEREPSAAAVPTNAPPPTRLRNRLWNAWNRRTSSAATTDIAEALSVTISTTAGEEEAAPVCELPDDAIDELLKESSPARSFTPPKKPRAWNRGRTESYGKTSSDTNSGELKRTPII